MRQLNSFLSVLLMLFLATPSLAAAGKPNILFILLDDMGYGDLTCYDPKAAPTPRIDQLAKEGIRFTQFYVSSPICSPSRCSFVTGQWPQRWKLGSYLFDRRLNERRGMAQWLDPEAPSVARALRDDGGYATGHFGKWHLGGGLDVADAPLITAASNPSRSVAAPLTWRRPPDRPGPAPNPFPDLAMRDGNFKFLFMADGSAPQLYDLSADPGESHNIAADHPDRVTQMKSHLLKWNSFMPPDNPDPASQPKAAPKAEG